MGHHVHEQTARGGFGLCVGGAVLRGPQAFAIHQQLLDFLREIGIVALLQRLDKLRLPMGAVADPRLVLRAQLGRPGRDAVLLAWAQRADPGVQALAHALGAFLDLLGQRRLEVFVLAFAQVLGQSIAHVLDLLIVQALQQLHS